MKPITINPNNEPFFSDDFISGFKCGAQRQYEADKADRQQGEMSDLISRQAAIDAVEFGITYAKAFNVNTGESKELFKEGNDALKKAVERLNDLPSAQPEIIRCKDCRWWDKYGDYDSGYCMAAKHGYWSEHWEIRIRRKYKGDFYCADAEPKGERK